MKGLLARLPPQLAISGGSGGWAALHKTPPLLLSPLPPSPAAPPVGPPSSLLLSPASFGLFFHAACGDVYASALAVVLAGPRPPRAPRVPPQPATARSLPLESFWGHRCHSGICCLQLAIGGDGGRAPVSRRDSCRRAGRAESRAQTRGSACGGRREGKREGLAYCC